MTYKQPNLQGFEALAAIQSNGQSKQTGNLEPDHQRLTAAAYEADE